MSAAASPEVSVVVATHNRAEQLRGLLASLRAQSIGAKRFEIVVVDDGSSDGTAALLAEESKHAGPALRVVTRDSAGGPAAARNAGWRAARAPFVAFTDDDCTTTPGWLAAALEVHAGEPDAFLQGPVGPEPAQAQRRGPLRRTIVVDALGPYYQTCNVFYPRALLERLDGFDEGLQRGEDTDLAWRAIESGAQPAWAAGAQVHHAVNELGLEGVVALALKWAPSMEIYFRHPQLREQVFDHRFFWKPNHYMLFRALVALVLPKRLRSFSLLLAWPYLMFLLKPGRPGGGSAWSAPAVALYDLVEMAAVAWYGLRRGRLVL